MNRLLTFLLFCSALSHAAVTIVQSKHGVVTAGTGTVTFTTPTVAGHSIIAVVAIPYFVVDGSATMTDDASVSNIYRNSHARVLSNNFNAGQTAGSEALITIAADADTGSTAVKSMQTVTFANWNPPGNVYSLSVWLYEVSGLNAYNVGFLPSVFAHIGSIQNLGGTGPGSILTASPVAQQTFSNFALGTSNLYFAVVAPTGPSISAVNAPWTLDTVQNGFAVAYLIDSTGVDHVATFTNGSSSTYTSSYAVMPSSSSPATGGCPGIPAGTALSACLSGVALAGGNAGWQVPTKPRLTITKATLANGVVGTVYSDTLSAVNGTPPYTWSIAFGSLPPGLSLNSSTGAITGTPTVSGTFNFTALVSDTSTPTAQIGTKDISITIACANPLQITSTSPLPPGTTGSTYSFQFQSSGGLAPRTWTGTNIPAGLAMSTGGLLNGIPTTSGTLTLNATVTDSCTPTPQVVTRPFDITINSVITINSTSPLPSGPPNTFYSATLSASGGAPPYTWTLVSGTLPTGLTLSPGGTINGTPTVASTSTFTLRVDDTASHFNSRPFTITIGCPTLTISSTSPLPDATQGNPYNFAFQLNGGAAPVTWTSAPLPAGLVLSSAGVLSGTPTTSGVYTFNVTETDSCSTPQVITKPFTLTVNGGLFISTASPLPSGVINQPYNTQLQAQGGIPPYTWSVPSGPIPAGAIDMLDWELMPLPDRNSFHLTGGLAPRYARLDGGLIWQMKAASGNPWDGNWYDDQYVYLGFTDNNDSSQQAACIAAGYTSCFVDPFASKTAQTLRKFTPRYFVPGSTVVLMTPPTLTAPPVNPGVRTTNCGTDNQPLVFLGNIKTTTFGPNNPPAWLVGNDVTATSPTIETDYQYSGNTSGVYQNIERFYFVKGLGWAGWEHALWNGTTYDPPDMQSADNHKVAGGLTSVPNFGCGVPSLPITGKLPDGVTRTSAPSLNLVDSTGVINGTPTQAGTSIMHVQVEDSVGTIAQKDLTLNIACVAFSIVSTSPLPNASQGSAYTFQFQSSGGIAPITWTESGALPTGMNLSNNGTLTGTPINFGSFLFTASATDSCQPQPTIKQKVFSLTVSPNSGPLTITTVSPLASGTEGSAYTVQLSATGGTSPYSFALTSGALPAGLSLSSVGVISGTPTSAGTSNFTVTVTDGIGTTSAKPFALIITCPSLAITSTSPLPGATQSQAYSFQFTFTGGIAPRTWAIASGSLPAGLTLSSAGLLSGAPSNTGTFSFSIRVTDSCIPTAQTTTVPFSLTVGPAPVPLSITSTSPLANGTEGTAYSAQLNATGGTAPYTWSLTSGSFPTGLTLAPSGLISGTPSAAGLFSFTARVTDSVAGTVTKPFTITIACPTLAITSTSPLSNGTQSQAYSFQFTSSGGILPVTWTLVTGTLPTGVTLSSSGLLSGTPTNTGTFNFTVRAADSCSPTSQTVSAPFTLVINTAPVALSIVTTSPLPGGTQGTPYSTSLQAAGGTAPYTWTIAAGTLPAGLILSSTGVISGTPTTLASVSVTFRVTDAVVATVTKVLAITITCPALTLVSTSPLPNGTQNSAYTFQFQASGGIAPYSWTRTGGTFPTGLTFPTSGLLSGTPTASGSFSPVVQVADACSTPQTASNTFALTIAPAVVPIVINTTTPLPAATVGVAYSTTLSASGGTTPYFWSLISGTLPAGLTLNSNGTISGTPTTSQTTTPTIQVTDSIGAFTTKAFSITASCPALAITSTSPLPAGTQNSPYSFQFVSSGGIAPRNWSVISGTLPVGLTLSAAGLLSGTPTGTGTSGFTVQVTDSCSTPQNATLVVSLTINPAVVPLQITTTSPLPPGTVGQAYSVQMAATGGTPPYGTWIVSSGALPSGLTLNTSTGVISGTPTLAQVTTPTIQVQDAVPNTTSKLFSITISTATTADNRYCTSSETVVGLSADGPAQPLQKCVYTALAGTPSPGSIITVTAGSFSDLQTKITAATCGQTIVIPALNGAVQAVYAGRLMLPARACTAGNWITVRTDKLANLPAENTRISPAWVGITTLIARPTYNQPATPGIYLPKLINTAANQSTVQCTAGLSRWRLIGLEVTSTSGVNIQNALISCASVDHFIEDRLLVHGGNNTTGQDKDVISQGTNLGTTTYGAVIDSYFYDIHCLTNTCTDATAIAPGGNGSTASGPIKEVNNFLEASGESCGLSGGGGQGAANTTLPLTDWEVRRNHCFKPLFWKTNDPSYFGTSMNVKNAFEMKNTNRSLVEGNIFDSTWGGQSDQPGTLVNLGSKNQSSAYSGNASSNGSGTLTWISGAVFRSTVVSPLCATPAHCLVKFNGISYKVQTFVDTHHITVTPAPPSSASAGFTAFDPGLNPTAIVSNITFRYNHLIHGSRALAIFAVQSDGGDFALGDNAISVHDNVIDDIDTKWNDSTGACCAWASSFQIQNQFAAPNNLHDISIVHNTALSFQTFGSYSNGNVGPSFGFGFQQSTGGVVQNLKLYDNIGTVGWLGSASVCNTAAANVLQRMQCYDTLNGVPQNSYCFDHNLFATTTQAPITGATSNPPYPAAADSPGCGFPRTGQTFVTSFAAIQFTNLNAANGGNYLLLNTSPGHNAAHDGTDLGANINLLNQYTNGVQ